MTSSGESGFSESITKLRLISIVFKSKRVNRNLFSYPTCSARPPRSQEALDPTSRVLEKKITRRLAHKSYHTYPSLSHALADVPRGISSITIKGLNNNHGIILNSGSQNGTVVFFGSILWNSTSQMSQSSIFCYDHNGHFNLQNEMRTHIMRLMAADSALYCNRLADCFLENAVSPLMITAVSNVSGFRLITQEFEVLNQSLYEILHNYHYGDIWLDVDNMSYEELLVLEDHIGYVSTGLSEEAALTLLKRSKYCLLFAEDDVQKEFCSICQDEYAEEDEMGTLDCGHSFHTTCIKKWLGYKNICPICKSTGLYTTDLLLTIN